ncbi:hypothetical protein [Priestia megaterium]|uniref:hypothetical protein n=1 Tax=Priestia megaterium TaxID=1404 RepID=UPI0011B7E394|nr:hypothetical protein [Priestia megaterium]QDZ83523.1 hypothetical protein D0441_03455 [Priestia megaterium]
MLNEKEILIHLVHHSRYVDKHFELAFKRDIAEFLIKEGYFEDDIPHKFSDKANLVLNNFYEENKEDVTQVLKKVKSPFSYELICKELSLSSNDGRAEYLIKRLAEDNVIIISESTDWGDRIKILFN